MNLFEPFFMHVQQQAVLIDKSTNNPQMKLNLVRIKRQRILMFCWGDRAEFV